MRRKINRRKCLVKRLPVSYTVPMTEQERCFAGEAASLVQILESREARASRQRRLLGLKQGALVCLMCNMPGPVKRCAGAKAAFEAGLCALLAMLQREGFALLYRQQFDPLTGPEGYFLVDAPPEVLKLACCILEEAHPLGRLWDLDVIARDGRPLSRAQLLRPPRTCLVCNNQAAACARNQAHPLADVQAHIYRILEEANTCRS